MVLFYFYAAISRSAPNGDLFSPLWTVACQVPRSMGFPRQEYWSGMPLPSPGDLPDPGIEQVDSLPPSATWEAFGPHGL